MLPVIFITGHGDIAMSVNAMKAGAVEFLAKPFANQDLLDAIHRGIELDRKRRSDNRQIQGLGRQFNDLTDGERAVMALVVKGLLNKHIAGELGGQRDRGQGAASPGHAEDGRGLVTGFGPNI